jgi:hypothetical protein
MMYYVDEEVEVSLFFIKHHGMKAYPAVEV